jgi:hypothetical protein
MNGIPAHLCVILVTSRRIRLLTLSKAMRRDRGTSSETRTQIELRRAESCEQRSHGDRSRSRHPGLRRPQLGPPKDLASLAVQGSLPVETQLVLHQALRPGGMLACESLLRVPVTAEPLGSRSVSSTRIAFASAELR